MPVKPSPEFCTDRSTIFFALRFDHQSNGRERCENGEGHVAGELVHGVLLQFLFWQVEGSRSRGGCVHWSAIGGALKVGMASASLLWVGHGSFKSAPVSKTCCTARLAAPCAQGVKSSSAQGTTINGSSSARPSKTRARKVSRIGSK